MNDSLYPLFSIFAFLGFLLVLVPLPGHLQAWNAGTCFFMMWAALACLNQFVNSVVWADDMLNRAPGWCDLSIRITMAASVGIPAASLCISRRLFHITRAEAGSVSRTDKRRAVLVDTLICVLLPLIYLALQYISQTHRFTLYEQLGCVPALANSIPTYFLSLIWPPLLAGVAAIYAALALRAFLRRRAALTQCLTSDSSPAPGLTPSRYLRLLALVIVVVLLTLPLGLLVIATGLKAAPLVPWHGLAAVHAKVDTVAQVPAAVWRGTRLVAAMLEFARWAVPVCALVFASLFVGAAEARTPYAAAWRALVSRFGRIGAPRAENASPAPQMRERAGSRRAVYPATSSAGSFSPTSTSASASTAPRSQVKRAESVASSFVCASRTSSFVPPTCPEEKENALGLVLDPETPVTATSACTTAEESPYALPLYLGWAARPYAASESPSSAGSGSGYGDSVSAYTFGGARAGSTRSRDSGAYAYSYSHEEEYESAREGDAWSPASDARELQPDELVPAPSPERAGRVRALV
ncbi:pheromone A receptor-domain-containing protein [Mycena belliarum]|uniref:Pheromone A receptor-domain-containing protein n=1 Tax=Mycena belliarum TaxID=1033014 RepID=A0AAD6TZL9_9AGAR|nr:pheromone A receptor-domain-containing protein [Mycena belliae]